MTSKELSSLRKLWLILAVICLSVSVNVLLATQGGAVILSIEATLGFSYERDVPEAIAGLWGVVYLGVFIWMESAVLRSHANNIAGGWEVRFPFRVFDLPPDRGVGRSAQLIALVVLMGLPLWSLGHSWDVMLNHGVLCVNDAGVWKPLTADQGSLWAANGAGGRPVRFTSSGELKPGPTGADHICASSSTTDYWAPAETWLLAGLTLLASVAVVRVGIALFGKGSKQGADNQ